MLKTDERTETAAVLAAMLTENTGYRIQLEELWSVV